MQPESFSNETLRPDEPKPDDIIQPEPQVVNKEILSTTVLSRMITFPISFYAIGSLTFLLVMALVCLGGLGYWGYSLGNNLTATQQQLAKLQENYDTLLAQNQKLSADLVEADTELIYTKLELTAAKTELATNSQLLDKKNKSMKDAALRFTVLRKSLIPLTQTENGMASEEEFIAFFSDWIQSIEDVHDPVLQSNFEDMVDAILAGKSGDGSFIEYLLDSIENDLK